MNEQSIFSYSDYRDFLKDYFSYLKKKKRQFSQRFFAQRAGFSSHTYFGKVINGERNLSEEAIKKIIKGFEFSSQTEKYFYALVRYNQSASINEKDKWYSELVTTRKNSEYYSINKSQVNYYEKWYYPVVRHLAVYADWNEDFKVLSKLVKPQITATQAKEAVENLEKMGLIIKISDGKYVQKSKALNVDCLPDFVKIKGRQEILNKAIESLSGFNANQRYTTLSLMSMSQESYEKAVEIFEEARKRIQFLAINDKQVDKVYQMALQIFPFSENIKKYEE